VRKEFVSPHQAGSHFSGSNLLQSRRRNALGSTKLFVEDDQAGPVNI